MSSGNDLSNGQVHDHTALHNGIRSDAKDPVGVVKAVLDGVTFQRQLEGFETLEPIAYGDRATLEFTYVNHAGKEAVRRVKPIEILYGKTPYYTEDCWLLKAFCLDKQEIRHFALKKLNLQANQLTGFENIP
jgi:predicted DNA-binding transcriptional regulator YafY